MKKNKRNFAILGATGAVGREIFKIIHEKKIEYSQLKLYATSRSAGEIFKHEGRQFIVEDVKTADFHADDLILASAGSNASKTWIPKAIDAGCCVIDNCSYWRMQKEVPLIVPEVNLHILDGTQKLIANPNCSTIQLVQVISPLHKAFGLKRVIISTYQAVSGAGYGAIASLKDETLKYPEKTENFFKVPIAFNVIPEIGEYESNGFTTEEMKLVFESRKILESPELQITATAVRVPVFTGHSESVLLQFDKEVKLEEVNKIVSSSKNVEIFENADSPFPTSYDIIENDNTLVGRIREDNLGKDWINMWIVSNNLRKGAALNAVQIAEFLISKDWI